ncbi:TPA-induced transmembrane protein isoform X2 [Trichomycterus rosablanca]|uniref:TPA-induced transmembrane protein isoform X2 n=1 Tax=Trichomycterus rosablanca TaxID=2290929 RepID=UPI002F3545D9
MDSEAGLELDTLNPVLDNNNDGGDRKDGASAGNCSNHKTRSASEQTPFIQVQVPESNGEHHNRSHSDTSARRNNTTRRTCDTIKNKLNEPVGKLRLWMIILLILALIALIILISVLVCRVPRVDVDEQYNVEEFGVLRLFRGNFTLKNFNLTPDPHSNSSDLLSHLQQKLSNIYRSSYALERYFSAVKIQPARTDSTTVEYELTFRMPEEHTQLVRFTLSREVVYHVFLQNLVDQDTEDAFYITSLHMDCKPL